jgi:hypothetical protein
MQLRKSTGRKSRQQDYLLDFPASTYLFRVRIGALSGLIATDKQSFPLSRASKKVGLVAGQDLPVIEDSRNKLASAISDPEHNRPNQHRRALFLRNRGNEMNVTIHNSDSLLGRSTGPWGLACAIHAIPRDSLGDRLTWHFASGSQRGQGGNYDVAAIHLEKSAQGGAGVATTEAVRAKNRE